MKKKKDMKSKIKMKRENKIKSTVNDLDRNPYSTMSRMQHLYRRHFWIGLIPHDEFPRSFMHLTVEMALFE